MLRLDGKKLGCFCKPGPCHGDVLVELVAAEKEARRLGTRRRSRVVDDDGDHPSDWMDEPLTGIDQQEREALWAVYDAAAEVADWPEEAAA